MNQPPYRRLLAIAATLLLVNLTVMSFQSRAGQSHPMLLGLLAAEAALVALWMAVANEPLARRLGVAVVLGALGFLTYMTGTYLTPQLLHAWKDHGWRALVIGVIHPDARTSSGISFAIQEFQFVVVFIAALMTHRFITKRVLCFRKLPSPPAPPFQFTLQHFLLSSILVALGFAWNSQLFDPERHTWGPYYGVWFVVLGFVYAVLSANLLLVCIEIIFASRFRRLWTAAGILAIPVCAAVGGVMVKLLDKTNRRTIPLLSSAVFFGTFAVLTTIVLLAARWMGFRLVQQRPPSLSLRESRALRPGEGPARTRRPIPSITLQIATTEYLLPD